MRLLSFVLASILCAACSASGEDIDLSADTDPSAPLTASDGVPSTPARDGHAVSRLVEFRDAAAAAPFWAAVDWSPPFTVSDIARSRDEVSIGTLVEADVPQTPRPDDLVPYEGAPTLYHLEVHLTVLDERGQRQTVQVPVLSSGAEGLALGDQAAERIIDLAPVGSQVLFVSSQGNASLVAMEANDASLLGYYSSLDDLASQHTLDSLRTAIENVLGT